jgi:hypothetical protein
MMRTDLLTFSVLSVPSVVTSFCLNHGGHGEHGALERK